MAATKAGWKPPGRPMGEPVGPEERAQIIAYIHEGKSYAWISKEVGRGPATVSSIAHAEGILPFHHTPLAANQGRRDYAKAERVGLLNMGFEKAEEILETYVSTPLQLQQWAGALSILIEKRRLEDGDATERSEVIDTTAAREQLRSKLTQLAERRRPGGVAQSA